MHPSFGHLRYSSTTTTTTPSLESTSTPTESSTTLPSSPASDTPSPTSDTPSPTSPHLTTSPPPTPRTTTDPTQKSFLLTQLPPHFAQLSERAKLRTPEFKTDKKLKSLRSAQLLASPVRQCAFTKFRVPSGFLLPFSEFPRPSNHALRMSKYPSAPPIPQMGANNNGGGGDRGAVKEVWIMPCFSPAAIKAVSQNRGLTRRYLSNSKRILERLGQGGWKRLQFVRDGGEGKLGNRRNRDPWTDQLVERVWREDMVQYVERELELYGDGKKLNP